MLGAYFVYKLNWILNIEYKGQILVAPACIMSREGYMPFCNWSTSIVLWSTSRSLNEYEW